MPRTRRDWLQNPSQPDVDWDPRAFLASVWRHQDPVDAPRIGETASDPSIPARPSGFATVDDLVRTASASAEERAVTERHAAPMRWTDFARSTPGTSARRQTSSLDAAAAGLAPGDRTWTRSLRNGAILGLLVCGAFGVGLLARSGTSPAARGAASAAPTATATGEPAAPAGPVAEVEPETPAVAPVASADDPGPATEATSSVAAASGPIPHAAGLPSARPATADATTREPTAEDHLLAGLSLVETHPDAAQAHFERALALDPGLAKARYGLALAAIAQGRVDDGVADLCSLRAGGGASAAVAGAALARVGQSCR